MRIEMNYHEYLTIFGNNGERLQDRIFDLNGFKMQLIGYTEDLSHHYNYTKRSLTLEFVEYVKPKSKEQLAAEESVRKAEEALQAAKDTLSKIKEK